MNDKKNIKFLWISPFGPLVTIRIEEISSLLLEKGITPIILTQKLKKKEISNHKGNLYYLHFQNPLFYNFKSKSLKYVREFVVKIAFFLGGMPFLFSDIKDFLKQNKNIDFIYATGPLYFTHMLGYLLKRKFRCKLVVEYTDPWSFNPYLEGKKRWFGKKLDFIIEKRILNSADIIVSLSDFLNSKLKTNFPFIKKKPIVAIEDGLNLLELKKFPEKDDNKIIITYAGKIYGKRNIFPLFKIVSDLNKEHFFKNNKILFKIYGYYPKELFEKILNKLNIREFFYLGSFVPRSEIINEIMKSDLALHIGENLDYPTIAFKVWEYLSCRKRILFFNIENSYRSDFIRKKDLGIVIPIDNLEKGKEIFKDLILNINNKKYDLTLNENLLKEFSWNSRAEGFIQKIINNLVK